MIQFVEDKVGLSTSITLRDGAVVRAFVEPTGSLIVRATVRNDARGLDLSYSADEAERVCGAITHVAACLQAGKDVGRQDVETAAGCHTRVEVYLEKVLVQNLPRDRAQITEILLTANEALEFAASLAIGSVALRALYVLLNSDIGE
jgi:hypothetical protein